MYYVIHFKSPEEKKVSQYKLLKLLFFSFKTCQDLIRQSSPINSAKGNLLSLLKRIWEDVKLNTPVQAASYWYNACGSETGESVHEKAGRLDSHNCMAGSIAFV